MTEEDKKEGKMNNTDNLNESECSCALNYESAFNDARKEIDRLWEENKYLKNVIKELSKVI